MAFTHAEKLRVKDIATAVGCSAAVAGQHWQAIKNLSVVLPASSRPPARLLISYTDQESRRQSFTLPSNTEVFYTALNHLENMLSSFLAESPSQNPIAIQMVTPLRLEKIKQDRARLLSSGQVSRLREVLYVVPAQRGEVVLDDALPDLGMTVFLAFDEAVAGAGGEKSVWIFSDHECIVETPLLKLSFSPRDYLPAPPPLRKWSKQLSASATNFPIGITRKNRMDWNAEFYANMLIFGSTGSGKTLALHHVLSHVREHAKEWETYAIDLTKIEIDKSLVTHMATTIEEAKTLISNVYKILQDRFTLMTDLKVNHITELQKISPTPRILLAWDGFVEGLLLMEGTLAHHQLGVILRLGRAAGIHVVGVSQVAKAAESGGLPNEYLQAFTFRVGMGTFPESAVRRHFPKLKGGFRAYLGEGLAGGDGAGERFWLYQRPF